jgi:hypothetical protein
MCLSGQITLNNNPKKIYTFLLLKRFIHNYNCKFSKEENTSFERRALFCSSRGEQNTHFALYCTILDYTFFRDS